MQLLWSMLYTFQTEFTCINILQMKLPCCAKVGIEFKLFINTQMTVPDVSIESDWFGILGFFLLVFLSPPLFRFLFLPVCCAAGALLEFSLSACVSSSMALTFGGLGSFSVLTCGRSCVHRIGTWINYPQFITLVSSAVAWHFMISRSIFLFFDITLIH